jgi:hypothetical protein
LAKDSINGKQNQDCQTICPPPDCLIGVMRHMPPAEENRKFDAHGCGPPMSIKFPEKPLSNYFAPGHSAGIIASLFPFHPQIGEP